MPLCPRGHESDLDDYCDVCGVAIGGAPPGAARSGAVGTEGEGREQAPGPRTGPSVCPDCANPMDGRFCERCGFDAFAVPARPATDPAAQGEAISGTALPGATAGGHPSSADPSSAGQASPDSSLAGPSSSGRPPADERHMVPNHLAPSRPPRPAAETVDGHDAADGAWHVVVAADRTYFDRIESEHGADPDIAFPRFCPERRFPLGSAQVVIGRRSRSRGIYPEIDLAGPPEDPAVSHLHALLIGQPDGSWAVVDLRSANRTYVNDSVEPIEPETPVPLRDGDQIRLGAWTRITLRVGPLPH
ncbi:FHA domain-containing protein [Micromonospora pisi]|uniref:FHA domain-containing protein n=1 Tax=Micromonospora pisi TaxID=589240 RepID=A0A495JAQ7_9ACTN|nr:FHA domain-containing protein [Micromonospora pisi]RKR85985.1 FHA domain-containing protein [Micromonospora pisi]